MPASQEETPLWYKDAVIYELHVKSFCDSNGDGIGDFPGLTQKLPYLHDLGITAIWVLPFYPSPLRDDGYDIADYRAIHPDYGTLRDFQEFLREAHRLGMRVITELVLNHTSDQHRWFQRARRARPGSVWRDFYVWSETTDRYRDARIIFKDFESSNWAHDPLAKSYYWHRFYFHQPDLNYDNPRVHQAVFQIMDFWLGMGVDGLRLDAIPYLYQREGTNCENLPETFAFLKKLRAYISEKYPDRMLLAEANQWPEDAASYFGEGDACQMCFHFPLMPRMFMALQMEDSFPISNILQQTPDIPEQCQWALFLRNHDELTLEMVTDEERDYMYRVYARDPRARINLGIRRRLAPLMGNDRRKIELMNVLLFTLPGTPIIYYGDEIGMGDNYYLGDRNGVRTPMQWSPDRNAGFSAANPQKLHLPVIIDPEYHFESINVENQSRNPSSLLWWMKRMIDLRKRFKGFGWGSLEFIELQNTKVLAMVRSYKEETVLVLVNLSRFAQAVDLNHPPFAGFSLEEMFGRHRFPPIKDSPYVVILGPYEYHLLQVIKVQEPAAPNGEKVLPELSANGSWENLLKGPGQRRLEQSVLPGYLRKCRWFQGKGRTINRVALRDTMPVPVGEGSAYLALVEVSFTEGANHVYLLPLYYLPLAQAEPIQNDFPGAALCRLKVGDGAGMLMDATYCEEFRSVLLDLFGRKRGIPIHGGRLSCYAGPLYAKIREAHPDPLASQVVKAEQSNSSIIYEKTLFLKLYRRIEEGVHPEVEIGRFLTERIGFQHVAPTTGVLEVKRSTAGEPIMLALLQGFVPNKGDAWSLTLSEMVQYLERVLARRDEITEIPYPDSLFNAATRTLSPLFQDLMGGFYPEMVSVIGKRTAEFHLALASATDDPAFAPEPFSLLYQRSLYQAIRSRARKVFYLLRQNLEKVAPELRPEAEELLALEREIPRLLQRFNQHKFSALKCRIHGDFHLGQLLYTGDDFMIVDFEGEPAKPVSERRFRHSPLTDVSGMMHSFYYAAYATIYTDTHFRNDDIPYLEPWAEAWYRCNSSIFLDSYLNNVASSGITPKEPGETTIMLDTFMLDKAIYELGYELNNRPSWVAIPLRGLISLLKEDQTTSKGEKK